MLHHRASVPWSCASYVLFTAANYTICTTNPETMIPAPWACQAMIVKCCNKDLWQNQEASQIQHHHHHLQCSATVPYVLEVMLCLFSQDKTQAMLIA